MAEKKVCILSLDGGGIRGILSGEIVKALERKLREVSGSEKNIGDFFDFIAGTSTGGIMASAYLVPNEMGTAKYSASSIQEIYTEEGDQIFPPNFFRKYWSYLVNEQYDAGGLEKELTEFFGDCRLSELIRPCLITSYDMEARNAKLFNSQSVKDAIHDFYMRDVVRATSAAPTYFEPAAIESISGGYRYHLIDGGIYANNPALCAYAEVRKMHFGKVIGDNIEKTPSAKNMCIVSIGTGNVKKPYRFNEYKHAGKISWVQPLVDMLMSGNSETVDYQLRRMYETLDAQDRQDYYRLEPAINLSCTEMDDVSQENIRNLLKDGQTFVERNEGLLEEIARKVVQYF
ncbi:MAG: patatin-like phospholipase family protein [Chitinophagales bacterium]